MVCFCSSVCEMEAYPFIPRYRAFAYAGPSMWNKLPKALRIASNVDTFKKQLKMYLFKKAHDI